MKKLLYILALLFATLQTFAQTYTYDSDNRLTKVVYNNGITVNYGYDALGNRTTKNVSGATAQTFTITTDVSPSGSGSVMGGGTYSDGTSVELHAIANVGYEFSKWSDNNTDNPRSMTVKSNQSFTAIFTELSATPTLVGDLNNDGKVNNYDLYLLYEAYLSGANATAYTDLDGDGELTIADIAVMRSLVESYATPLESNGHLFVDLGLPSGALWATCNVGATTPEELGEYYAWGETEEKEDYSWSTYKWCNGERCNSSNATLTKYCDRGGYGSMDGKVSLEPEDDVANVKWGGDWHIPTQAEFQELMDHCTVKYIKIANKKHVYQFTGPNGNSIVMPASGEKYGTDFSTDYFCYWSADLTNSRSNTAWAIEYSSSSSVEFSGNGRYQGYAIRPVLSEYTPAVHLIRGPDNYAGHDLVDLGLPSGTLWAKCNLGASSPEGNGCYYAWGEIDGSCDYKSRFSEETYKFYDGSGYTKYTPTTLLNLETEDDAATTSWGKKWRIPTNSEITELINTKYTVCEWTTINNVNGYLITSVVEGFEGNSIFLPAAGYYAGSALKHEGDMAYYWASNLDTSSGDEDANYARYMVLKPEYINKGCGPRRLGVSVRPVVSLSDINE